MMEGAPYKFGLGPAGGPYVYPDIYEREPTSGPDRLVIGPSSGQIDLLLALSEFLPEPLGVLYVLVVPRTSQEAGRYQSPWPLKREEVIGFASRFRKALERDARHHLWIASPESGANLVYDNHNVIYAYGPLERFEKLLSERGFKKGLVRFPVPHMHRYNKEFDADVGAILAYWDWQHFPLRDEDDP